MNSRSPLFGKRPFPVPERGRVLVVEDEPAIRGLLVEILEPTGFDISVASTGLEAVHALQSEDFELMLLDLNMPAMGGLELLRSRGSVVRETGILILTGCNDITTAVEAMQLGALDYVLKPFDADRVIDAVRKARQRMAQRAEENRGRLDVLLSQSEQLSRVEAELAQNSERALEALVAALDARERETQNHSKRVSEYAVHLATVMGVDEATLGVIRRGGMLHDIGKIGVSDRILLKEGPLSQSEWLEMKNHPDVGHGILQTLPDLEAEAELVLTHHERFDGTGYPSHLKGSQIPMVSRIFAVADSFDAMTSNRPYRRAMSWEAAFEEIGRCSGTQFDPEVVQAFRSIPLDTWITIRTRTVKQAPNSANSNRLLKQLLA